MGTRDEQFEMLMLVTIKLDLRTGLMRVYDTHMDFNVFKYSGSLLLAAQVDHRRTVWLRV